MFINVDHLVSWASWFHQIGAIYHEGVGQWTNTTLLHIEVAKRFYSSECLSKAIWESPKWPPVRSAVPGLFFSLPVY